MRHRRVAFHWSGGKDSALALGYLLADESVTVDRLATTTEPGDDQSTVHGLPCGLLQAQAASLGIHLQTIPMPGGGLEGYMETMEAAARAMRAEGIDAFAFGDLAASGVRDLKHDQFGPLGIEVVEPLWEFSSTECIEAFLASGIRAVTVVVDAGVLDAAHLGVEVDRAFIDGLPDGCDPCGELGEYHTFVFDGPMFARPVPFTLGATRHLERTVATTDGPVPYAWWLATPRLAKSDPTLPG